MAHRISEFTRTYVVSTMPSGHEVKVSIICLSGSETAALFRAAQDAHDRGHTEIHFLTERVWWRGKNGKRQTEVLSREPVLFT